jgi:hypothetical protein
MVIFAGINDRYPERPPQQPLFCILEAISEKARKTNCPKFNALRTPAALLQHQIEA